MKHAMHRKLDFDYLTGLAQSDPSEFERLRQSAIDSYISTLPLDRQERMRRLQWRIDQERRKHTPMGACVKLSTMMWDHLLSSEGLLGLLQRGENEIRSMNTASIITFPCDRGR